MNTLRKFLEENYNSNDYIARMCLKDDGVVNYCYRPQDLLKRNNRMADVYMALNTMQFVDHQIRRDQEHVRRLKFLYVDLDTYHTDFNNEQILMNLEENYFNISIPVPSYVVSSGRGLYLLWRIDEHINALPRWKRAQEYLYDRLREFGADKCVTSDYARVFRIPGSINSKSGQEVKILRSYDRKYTLYEILQEFTVAQPVKVSRKERNRRFIPFNKTNKLFVERMRDLKTLLLDHRDQEDSYRENILFLYRYYHLCMYKNREAALKAVSKLNDKLQHPLPEKEIIRATSSAEKYFLNGCSFSISNKKLISWLELTEEELEDMPSVLTDKRLKDRRARENRKSYIRRRKSAGKQLKRDEKLTRYKAEYKLLKDGKTQAEICNSLGISRATYYADLKIVRQLLQAIKQPEKCREQNWPEIYRKIMQEQRHELAAECTEILRITGRNGPPNEEEQVKEVIIS